MTRDLFQEHSDESKLKEFVTRKLSPSFEIRPNVEGNFIIDGTPVVVDYLLFPKPALVAQGFVEEWIGLEVKHPEDKANKPIRFAWQCITYAQSKFDGRRPPFVLMFPNIRFFYDEREAIAAGEIYHFLQKANVGVLDFLWNGEWQLVFGGSNYFSSERGLGPHPNCALKRYVGTWR